MEIKRHGEGIPRALLCSWLFIDLWMVQLNLELGLSGGITMQNYRKSHHGRLAFARCPWHPCKIELIDSYSSINSVIDIVYCVGEWVWDFVIR